jgi:hypothetical protein
VARGLCTIVHWYAFQFVNEILSHNCFEFSIVGRHLVEFDPSLSLHDDAETAVTIAGGYLGNGRQVYVMGLNVPKVCHF